MHLARDEYPDVDVEAYLSELAGMAHEARAHLCGDLTTQVRGLCRYLFHEMGFRGNSQAYYDPRNSYFNQVLDSRLGIPITLSAVAMGVGARAGLPLFGVGLPGHFICRYQSTFDEVYVDAFHHGKLLTKADCIQYLVSGNHSLQDEFLAPVSTRRTLMRICSNLHQIYCQMELAEETTRLQRYLVALAR